MVRGGKGGRTELLGRYTDQLGRLTERRMVTAALVAAKRDAEYQASQARQATVDARASAEALREEIRHRVQAQAHLAYLANHDPLTSLANRTLLNDRLAREMEHNRRTGSQLALLCLDLDHFKDVNDTLGHAAGDALLQEVARRLQDCARNGDMVARMGGDEFAILQGGITHPNDAGALADRLIAALSCPVELSGRRIFVGASIGITLCPRDGDGAEQLLRNADLALYCTKREGRNGFRFFDAQLNAEVRRRASLEQALHEALQLDQLSLAFQPQIEFNGGRIIGAEALLRWQHPEYGAVSPEEFVPAAERSGLINGIGAWVLVESCRQAVRWDAAGLPPLKVAVNLATTQFKGGDVPRLVADALAQTGLAPARLELEVTETGVMQDIRDAAEILSALHAIGVNLAIDDFGTGYSSLSYLRRLPVDSIKIDRSFVSDITQNDDAAVVARTIVTLGHNLRLQVVAEGVETDAHARYLRGVGCDVGQGFLFGPPMPAHGLAAMLARPGPGAGRPNGVMERELLGAD